MRDNIFQACSASYFTTSFTIFLCQLSVCLGRCLNLTLERDFQCHFAESSKTQNEMVCWFWAVLGGNGAASQPEVIDDHEVVEMELEDTFTFIVAHPAKPNIFSNAVFLCHPCIRNQFTLVLRNIYMHSYIAGSFDWLWLTNLLYSIVYACNWSNRYNIHFAMHDHLYRISYYYSMFTVNFWCCGLLHPTHGFGRWQWEAHLFRFAALFRTANQSTRT